MRTLRVLRELARRHPWFLAVAAPLLALAGVVEASPLLGLVPLVDLLIHPDLSQASPITLKLAAVMRAAGAPVSLPSVAALILALIVAKSVVAGAVRYAVTRLHFRAVREMTLGVLGEFFAARLQFFLDNGYGVLGNTLLKESDKLGLALESAVTVLSHALRIAAYLGAALLVSWELTGLALLMLGAAVGPFLLMSRLSYRIGAAHTAAGNRFHGAISESLTAIKLIAGFGMQRRALASISEAIEPYIASAMQFVMVRAAMPLAFEPLAFVVAAGVLFVGRSRIGLEVSSLFMVLYALRSSAGLALSLVTESSKIDNFTPALEQIERLAGQARELKERTGGGPFERLERGIELSGVRFAYPGREDALRGVSLDIPKGAMTAIVGRSGGGKTTILDLLLGFFDPQDGEIRIDGVPFQKFELTSWRRKVGYVPQEPFLFHASLRENLLWGRADASASEIESALAQANALEFVRELPKGLETVAGDRGARLSVGQRQRIALARALLRKPELLLLDEATSALDSHSERLIQESVERVSETMTVVAVAHRLSTIRKAARIHLLADGRVLESGSFEELLRRGGEFQKAARLQGLAET